MKWGKNIEKTWYLLLNSSTADPIGALSSRQTWYLLLNSSTADPIGALSCRQMRSCDHLVMTIFQCIINEKRE